MARYDKLNPFVSRRSEENKPGQWGLPARFWDFVHKTDTCWLWQRSCSRLGYARIVINGVAVGTHRAAYEAAKGKIPDGLHIDHLCREPRCVNPEHLEAVTPAENVRRYLSVTNELAARTHCKRGHLFDETNTAYNNKNNRSCKACRSVYRKQKKELN